MKCAFCGGRMEAKAVTFQHEENGLFILIENVPAEVCSACGETTYSPEVTDRLLRLATQESRPERMIEVPVFNFAKTA